MKEIYKIFYTFLDWRSKAVLRRHLMVFIKTWKTAFIPPLMEPIVTLFSFGLGVGLFVNNMTYHEHTFSYLEYIVPGIMVNTFFYTSFFEGLYGSYVRMIYQKTFDGMLTTQLEMPNIIWGEILWGSSRALINAMVLCLVLIGMNLMGLIQIHLWFLFPCLLIGFLACILFTSTALIIASSVPTIDHLSYGVFLIAIPLSFISNTFFPMDRFGNIFNIIQQINPVYHLSEFMRGGLLLGGFNRTFLIHILVILVFIPVPVYFSHISMRKRVLGE
ncbi:MAG: hypothetical protein A3H98_07330 [Bacteroidetes bacterium RIFCSPLOWO2_02_FULL_36_8]|nr:MAG: hypothetical protein A3H98_07330 [Bacteroidetes bacterium RIFCSPLOWO2_02_FULL_36_8]OFY69268.1 MAG: hypothetical protein A3G23_02250 [Bacteroidetes bacterium RIFCSPLOWO2_12_FULL_37_12]